MSTTTKRAFASSLKNKLQTKPLEKITVTDICEDCEVNRQTFYNHFKDIFDLVEWIYTVDADKAMDGKKAYQTWEEGFLHLFEYALKEKSFVIRPYPSISREHLENFFNSAYGEIPRGASCTIPILSTGRQCYLRYPKGQKSLRNKLFVCIIA